MGAVAGGQRIAVRAADGPCWPTCGSRRFWGRRSTRMRADEEALPRVCLTFDDGLADNAALALPVLRSMGIGPRSSWLPGTSGRTSICPMT